MEVTLTPVQKHVDDQITARLNRICSSEYQAHLKKYKNRKSIPALRYSQVVTDLLTLRQLLYNAESLEEIEGISSLITTGEIQNAFLKN